MNASDVTVVSRDTGGGQYRWHVRGWNLNAWCVVPGSPLQEIRLLPNSPLSGQVHLQYEPVELPDVDTLTLFVVSEAPTPTPNQLAVEVGMGHRSAGSAATTRVVLGHGDERAITLPIDYREGTDIRLTLGVSFDSFIDSSTYGHVSVRYAVAYRRNRLNDLFNTYGSDKGTEVTVGAAAPHCYGLAYDEKFRSFSDEQFAMLEIGLESSSRLDGDPSDAPSLRAWREYFPHAAIFGYDVNDFSFLQQRGTQTFQGDQSSREDLQRFLDRHPERRFRLVIDDGSHASSHQQVSLATLFPRVADGGVYVIEDLHWQPFEEDVTTLEVLQAFIETKRFESPFLTEAEQEYLDAHVDRVEIVKPNDAEVAFVHKGVTGD